MHFLSSPRLYRHVEKWLTSVLVGRFEHPQLTGLQSSRNLDLAQNLMSLGIQIEYYDIQLNLVPRRYT